MYLRLPELGEDADVRRPISEDFPDEARIIAIIIGEWSAIEAKLIGLAAMSVEGNGALIDCMLADVQGSRNHMNVIAAALEFMGADNGPYAERLASILKNAAKPLTMLNKYAHSICGALMKSKIIASPWLVIAGIQRTSPSRCCQKIWNSLWRYPTDLARC